MLSHFHNLTLLLLSHKITLHTELQPRADGTMEVSFLPVAIGAPVHSITPHAKPPSSAGKGVISVRECGREVKSETCMLLLA